MEALPPYDGTHAINTHIIDIETYTDDTGKHTSNTKHCTLIDQTAEPAAARPEIEDDNPTGPVRRPTRRFSTIKQYSLVIVASTLYSCVNILLYHSTWHPSSVFAKRWLEQSLPQAVAQILASAIASLTVVAGLVTDDNTSLVAASQLGALICSIVMQLTFATGTTSRTLEEGYRPGAQSMRS